MNMLLPCVWLLPNVMVCPSGLALGDGARADGAGAARHVLDHDLLAERARDVGGDDARDHIGRTAGRIGHDHLDRSGRLPGRGGGGLREGRVGEGQGDEARVRAPC